MATRKARNSGSEELLHLQHRQEYSPHKIVRYTEATECSVIDMRTARITTENDEINSTLRVSEPKSRPNYDSIPTRHGTGGVDVCGGL